jgi:hypothetical protein
MALMPLLAAAVSAEALMSLLAAARAAAIWAGVELTDKHPKGWIATSE